ncbi:hypothetical protein B0T19DRAFT_481403 [Cercophora scortea]|uniref:Uncharacterized protein n=1 Tax=Cercophora scortea TaxID=314031 RepID=A0AAE0MLX7_9PEZI|nr:hypothetical protein B0T19DRAFT_481403 [Cercophora scortea]
MSLSKARAFHTTRNVHLQVQSWNQLENVAPGISMTVYDTDTLDICKQLGIFVTKSIELQVSKDGSEYISRNRTIVFPGMTPQPIESPGSIVEIRFHKTVPNDDTAITAVLGSMHDTSVDDNNDRRQALIWCRVLIEPDADRVKKLFSDYSVHAYSCTFSLHYSIDQLIATRLRWRIPIYGCTYVYDDADDKGVLVDSLGVSMTLQEDRQNAIVQWGTDKSYTEPAAFTNDFRSFCIVSKPEVVLDSIEPARPPADQICKHIQLHFWAPWAHLVGYMDVFTMENDTRRWTMSARWSDTVTSRSASVVYDMPLTDEDPLDAMTQPSGIRVYFALQHPLGKGKSIKRLWNNINVTRSQNRYHSPAVHNDVI